MATQNKIKYAGIYTLKWLILPIVSAAIFIFLVKNGIINGETDNRFVHILSWFVDIFTSRNATYFEIIGFSLALIFSFFTKRNEAYSLAKLGVAKCVFFISFFPLIYLICMFANIKFIPPNSGAYFASCGYLIGGVILYLLPTEPPP